MKECRLRSIFEELDTDKIGAIKLSQLREILRDREFMFPVDSLDRVFKQVLGVDLQMYDQENLIDYN